MLEMLEGNIQDSPWGGGRRGNRLLETRLHLLHTTREAVTGETRPRSTKYVSSPILMS